MPTEGFLPVRRALLSALKADEDLTDIVPAASIYPGSAPANPSWPFIKTGSPSAVPISADTVDGDETIIAVHSFAKARKSGDAVLETAEDYTDRIGAAVLRALHRQRLDLGGGKTARVTRTGFQLLQDSGEADAYHHVANFRVRVLS